MHVECRFFSPNFFIVYDVKIYIYLANEFVILVPSEYKLINSILQKKEYISTFCSLHHNPIEQELRFYGYPPQ